MIAYKTKKILSKYTDKPKKSQNTLANQNTLTDSGTINLVSVYTDGQDSGIIHVTQNYQSTLTGGEKSPCLILTHSEYLIKISGCFHHCFLISLQATFIDDCDPFINKLL